MIDTKDLHSGHRARMMDRFLSHPDSLTEHELLEMLLFYSIPRADTNAMAHKLLNEFGEIKRIIHAPAEQLNKIIGLGKRTAVFLQLLGKFNDRCNGMYSIPCDPNKKFSFETNKQDAIDFFADEYQEKLYVNLLDGNYGEIKKLVFTQQNHEQVCGVVTEIAKAISAVKPTYLLIAHNHPSGSPHPSEQDDFTTAKINLLCNLHGIILADHIIVSGKQAFSYFASNRLSEIKNTYNIDDMLSEI